MKRVCLVCIDELLSAFLKFPEVDKLTEANGGYKKFGFQNVFSEGRSTVPNQIQISK